MSRNVSEDLIIAFMQSNLFWQVNCARSKTKARTEISSWSKSLSGGDSGKETVSVQTATTLAQSMEKLAVTVTKLTGDLETSKQRCDNLEQYSRRNNIIISNVPS